MPIHDWTKVDAGIFHHFHHGWIDEIARALNRGLLPHGHYALAEQIAGGLGPDVLTLQGPTKGKGLADDSSAASGVALASAPPRVRFRTRTEVDQYATKANAIVIRHTSNHEVIAMVEIVSPGNKNNRHGFRAFVDKATEVLRAGIHLLIVDLFPPGPRDPQGIHKAIWDEFIDNDFVLPTDKPLTLVAYTGGLTREAFIEPIAINDSLPDMPLFLTPTTFIYLPLEATYQLAWEGVPSFWREILVSA